MQCIKYAEAKDSALSEDIYEWCRLVVSLKLVSFSVIENVRKRNAEVDLEANHCICDPGCSWVQVAIT